MKREIKVNNFYRHFKGNIYKVLFIALDSEDLSKKVIYQDVNNKDKIWVRDYDEFNSKVDKIKYPNITQEYRFERVENI